MEANPVANEDRLQIQREEKQKYCQQVKESQKTIPLQKKTIPLKVKKIGSKTFWINPILHMSPEVEMITIILRKLMVKASMSRNNILCGHSIIY